MIGVSLALLWWCACASPGRPVRAEKPVRTVTEQQLIPHLVGGRVEYRVPADMEEPIPPAPYTGWFVPSSWMQRLAERFNDIPDAFVEWGSEYCCVIFVDSNRMVHASIPVRWSDPGKTKYECPPLGAGAAPNDTKQVGIAHQHQNITGPSEFDVNLACATLIKGKPDYTGAIVSFVDGRQMLSGIDPETGREAAIPSQHFLIIRRAGEMQVFMWVRLVHPRPGRKGAVALYVPSRDGTDNWRQIAECWAKPGREVRKLNRKVLEAECDPDNIWR